jgi:hypothetical protein
MSQRIYDLIRKIVPASIRQRMQTIEPGLLSCIVRALKLRPEANVIDIEDIRISRSKDTVFIMGCGYSVNDISDKEWSDISNTGDVFSFNLFYMGRFVPITYHACGEIGLAAPNYATVLLSKKHRQAIRDYYAELFRNPYYANTTYFLRYKINHMSSPVTTAIWSVFFKKVFRGKRLSLYSINANYGTIQLPSDDIKTIAHHEATLSDVINISYILGYKSIVLVGVDLYDRRYFWLGDKTREEDAKLDKSYSDVHQTADTMVNVMDAWNRYLSKKGTRLYIYNPRSLLRSVLPLYNTNISIERNGET